MTKDTAHRSGAVQLRLRPYDVPGRDWRLDERTRRVGREGVARARQVLSRVAPPDAQRRAS